MRPILLFFKFLLLFSFVYLALATRVCPRKCYCSSGKVSCLQQDLLAVPKVADATLTMDLRFNKIAEIEPGEMAQLHIMRALLLNDNRLETLRYGAFHGLWRLKYLYLYRNRIRTIEPGTFEDLRRLQQLYLHLNDIHIIDPRAFSNLPRMERLYLHSNNIETIPSGTFAGMPKLRKLRLDSNALICDCSMAWFVNMMAQHNGMLVDATCYKPENISGMPLAALDERDFPCQSPKIAEDPKDIRVNFGESAQFTCVASGEPMPDIVWLQDSSEIPIDGTRYDVINNRTLMVYDTSESDGAYFECMAKNTLGEAHSKPARMTVQKHEENEPPVFTALPSKQSAKLAQQTSFDCEADGYPKPHIVWFFNDERILLSDRISIQHNGTISIQNIQESDAGSYTCQAENVNGKVSVSVELEVTVAPVFIVTPKDKTVKTGDNVDFRCSAKGVPNPLITWFRDTLPIVVEENTILSSDNQNLTLILVTTEDEGIYHCRAESTEGFIEASALLKVESIKIIKPHIVSKPEDSDAFKETTIQLLCEVESEPPAAIEWRKDGSYLNVNDKYSITIIGSLIVKNLTVKDTGRYECSVFNDYGRDTASAFLTVRDHILPGDAYVNIALTEAARDVDQAIERSVDEVFRYNNQTDIGALYRITRFPNAPAREVARAAEIYERTLDIVRGFIAPGRKITSADPFVYQNILSNQHLEVIARLSGCVAHREKNDCTDMCYHSKYRSFDGTCNNFANPTWGSSLSGFRRILFPIYENGFSEPVGWNKEVKYNGFTLPSARLVSTTIISTNDISADIEISHMTMQWGQWLDHDLDHSLPSVSSQTWDGVDCKKTCDYAAPCFPIDVPSNDPRITNRRCIDFVRTSAVCGSGLTSVLFGRLQTREQINQLTSYIDASQVYGFENIVAEDLRDVSNENGLLRVGATFAGRKPLLPTVGVNGMDCRRNLEESNRNCFVAGDIRANEQVGLAAMHTIWMREHNRIAVSLKVINSFWDGDRVYQEARKVIGAEMQMITYEHWLPIIVGPEGYKQLGEYTGYDPNLNPSISNVFATAALRFGHSMINPILHRYDENFETIPEGHLMLRDAFFAPWRLTDEGGVDPLLRGMFITPAKLKTPTQNLNSELTEKLFYSAHAVALDLAAMNIQRSRDHAIPPYTKWRQYCNMSEVNDFDDLAGEIPDSNVRQKLQDLYGSVHNIDVWVGGILENQVEGGKVGPLFRCLLVEQFKRLRDGDRFWYENPSNFKPEQLRQIKQTSLARVLCDNGDKIDTIGENVFYLPEVQDGLISCDDLPSIDLRYWADCEGCSDNNVLDRAKRSTRVNTDELVEEERLSSLEETQQSMEGTIASLKRRIEYLEQTCKVQ